MSNEEDSKNKAGLVPSSQSAALSLGGTPSLASRGLKTCLPEKIIQRNGSSGEENYQFSTSIKKLFGVSSEVFN